VARKNLKNSFAGWKDGTKIQNKMIEAILGSSIHIICTMRTKMETILEAQQKDGKTFQVPRKVGLAPVQRGEIEFEFDMTCDMNVDHQLIVTKSRFESLQDIVETKPGKDFTEKIMSELAIGDKIIIEEKLPATEEQLSKLREFAANAAITPDVKSYLDTVLLTSITEEKAKTIIEKVQRKMEAQHV
jgi:hypothetical protein